MSKGSGITAVPVYAGVAEGYRQRGWGWRRADGTGSNHPHATPEKAVKAGERAEQARQKKETR